MNLSEVEPGTEEWEVVKSQVYGALHEYGCFEAIFRKISAENRKGFAASLKETKKLCVSGQPFQGYSYQRPTTPLLETIAVRPADIKNVASNLWPELSPDFSKTVPSFLERLTEVDGIVRRMIVEYLGLEKYLEEHMNSTYYNARLMKYAAPGSKEQRLGAGDHTDKNITTVLYQNEVNGLEVQTKDGDQWIRVKPSPDSFIVQIGDSFQAWTNGRLLAPIHHVILTGDKARYSVGLFANPKPGHKIRAPAELTDEEHPMLYKPFEFQEFLESEFKLPVIDLSEVEPGTEEWEVVKSQVFDLPLESKKLCVSDQPFMGYNSYQRPISPLLETIAVRQADIKNIASNLWPELSPDFGKIVPSFMERLTEVDGIVRRMIVEYLGLEKYLEEHMNSTYYNARLMKYAAPGSNEQRLGAGDHTDKNITTVLYQNEVNGLEVQAKDGDRWIRVKPSPDSFIIQIGESFQAWINGRLLAPIHHVILTGDKARYSAGLFAYPKPGYKIRAPAELIDEEHPMLYKPFEYQELLGFYGTEAGRRAAST
ncbi:hypothetical protein Tsubulata_011781, partial [Turnera subulata]